MTTAQELDGVIANMCVVLNVTITRMLETDMRSPKEMTDSLNDATAMLIIARDDLESKLAAYDASVRCA